MPLFFSATSLANSRGGGRFICPPAGETVNAAHFSETSHIFSDLMIGEEASMILTGLSEQDF